MCDSFDEALRLPVMLLDVSTAAVLVVSLEERVKLAAPSWLVWPRLLLSLLVVVCVELPTIVLAVSVAVADELFVSAMV